MNSLNNSQFAQLLELSPRQAREISAKLESLGFTISRGLLGDRKIVLPLALAVKKARDADKPVKSLLSDASLTAFRSSEEVDPLLILLQARADLSILRQGIAPIVAILREIEPNLSFNPSDLGLPDPESGEF